MEISKSDLKALSDLRIQEAKVLLENKQYSGAYYIAGYSVELALKACISSNFRADFLPDKKFVEKIYNKGHDLSNLIVLAGLRDDLDSEVKINPHFLGNWGVLNEWNEESRYRLWDAINANSLYEAITHPTNGILQWLKKYY